MSRTARMLASCLAVTASLLAAGCGSKEETVTHAQTEGPYVSVDGLKYQVQISRILDPTSPEDQAYLRGVPASEQALAQDEVWFGIFMRVENDETETGAAATEFEISDTQDDVFRPIELDEERNVFLYQPRELEPGKLLPEPDSPASDNTIGGSLILFKVKTGALYNRPLELEIASPSGGENGTIDLDV
jgi:hypothetical protein